MGLQYLSIRQLACFEKKDSTHNLATFLLHLHLLLPYRIFLVRRRGVGTGQGDAVFQAQVGAGGARISYQYVFLQKKYLITDLCSFFS